MNITIGRRNFLKLAAGSALTLVTAYPSLGKKAKPISQALEIPAPKISSDNYPNILWLVSEDNDCFLGCYGDKLARTPTLDKLAGEGVLYEKCFAQPVCAPSRFTLISGMFAVGHGPAQHMRAQGKIPSWLKGFPTYLRMAGYYTSNNAKTDYNSPISIPEAWNECGKQGHWRKRSEPKQPFFSVFNHEVTHESCLFPEKELPLDFPSTDPAQIRIPPYQPDTPEMRADWVRYYNHMKVLDEQLAAKLKALEDDGLAENTIVFYYADNGGVLARSKRFLQESGVHVPLIIRFPKKWQHLAPAAPGSRIKEPVSFVDFAPTVLSLAGPRVRRIGQGRAERKHPHHTGPDGRALRHDAHGQRRPVYLHPQLPARSALCTTARLYVQGARLPVVGTHGTRGQAHARDGAILGHEAVRGAL